MPKSNLVQAIDRALRILQVLGRSDTPLPLSKIAQSTKMPASTTHRLLASLREHDLVRYNPETHTYAVGLGVLSLAESARAQIPLYRQAQPLLERLAAQVNETATLVLANGASGTYAAMARSARDIIMSARIGEHVPLHCSSAGKVILAFLPDKELNDYLNSGLRAYTPNTITNPYQLHTELEQVRQEGLAIDNEERELGMRCIAAPVLDDQGKLRGAIGISGPSSRVPPGPNSDVADSVRAAAYDLSVLLGYRGPRGSSHAPVMNLTTGVSHSDLDAIRRPF